jgi:hypothetical protein
MASMYFTHSSALRALSRQASRSAGTVVTVGLRRWTEAKVE